jgi:Avidin family
MSLSGEWINELGSRMKLEADEGGYLVGTYHTQVGNAEGVYALVGAYDKDGGHGSQSLAFCVSWKNDDLNSHSATAWAGQFQRDKDGDVIRTTWLLTRETDNPDDWESTNVGQDVYRRVLEGQRWASARAAAPHPMRSDSR